MKYLSTLLAIIILILSVQPVCSSTNSLDNCCQESTCCDDNGHRQEKQTECSSCNPFQQCGCCAFSVILTPTSSLEFSKQTNFVSNYWVVFKSPFIDEPILGFWQPPKLS